MSELMKTHRTEVEIRFGKDRYVFSNVPQSKVKPIITSLKEYRETTIPWRELSAERMTKQGGEAAYMLRVSRERQGLSQNQLAKLLKTQQSNISQMECGKRGIGKGLAKRLSKILNVDYRVFL